jgi:UDP-glucose 4-epimerase
MNILVTGGAGYIGSHTIVELLNSGHKVVVVDNLSNSSSESLRRIEEITNKAVPFYEIDICDSAKLEKVFIENNFDAIMHFAGLKAVGESVEKPLVYYRNNLDSTLSLLEMMDKYDIKRLVYSSSATVYGSATVPYTETSVVGQGITSPYGQTKYMVEQIIKDFSSRHPQNTCTILRYFNPVGAHESGMIGEDPKDIPNNLMPFISQVASGKRDRLSIFGNDYDTPDGTCVRDYIHVVDLAKGHLSALTGGRAGYNAYNLGSGTGTSVLELVNAFIKVTGKDVPYTIKPRRLGDLPAFYANPKKAHDELNWKTEKSIEQACQDSWRWQSQNPNGYNAALITAD